MSSKTEIAPAVARRNWLLPGAVFLLAFAIHLLYLALADWGEGLRSPFLYSDAFFYHYTAWFRAFIDSDGGFSQQLMQFSPYVTLLTGGYQLFGPHAWVAPLINALCMSLAVMFMALTARTLFGELEGWLAGLLGAACGLLVFFAGLTVKTNLVMLLLSAGVYAVSSYLRTPQPVKLFLAVGLLGVAALDRYHGITTLILAAVICVAWQFRRRRLRDGWAAALAVFAGVALVLVFSPWRPAQQDQAFFSSPGLNFYIGNSPQAWGGYARVPAIGDDIVSHRRNVKPVTEQLTGKTLSRDEVSRYWFDEALYYIGGNPLAYVKLQLRKLGLLLAQGGQGQPEQYRAWRWQRPALVLALVDLGLIIALGIIGMTLAWPLHKQPGVAFLLGAFAFYAVAMWLFFVHERYRVPFIVYLTPFAAYALARAILATRRRKRWGIAALVVGLYTVSWLLNGLIPAGQGWASDLARHRQRVAELQQRTLPVHHLMRQVVLELTAPAWAELSQRINARGFDADAERFAENAIALSLHRIDGYRALVGVYRRRMDVEAAQRFLKRLKMNPDLPPDDKRKLVFLAERVQALGTTLPVPDTTPGSR